MARVFLYLFSFWLLGSGLAMAQDEKEFVDHTPMLMDHGDGHMMDMEGGMVMGQNKDRLPGGCDRISQDTEMTVRAGHKYAKKFPGTMYAFDQQEWRFKPCTRLTVHFINEDSIRHQWMVHGLPKYLYDKGMFHLEVTGPGRVSGTLILPNDDKTYLVHCDIAQHMEKGMKGQLVVGKGSLNMPSIPGLTTQVLPDNYGPGAQAPAFQPTPAAPTTRPRLSGMLVIGVAIGIFGMPFLVRMLQTRYKDMTMKDFLAYARNLLTTGFNSLVHFITWLVQRIGKKNKYLPQK
jgi:plastocyanin